MSAISQDGSVYFQVWSGGTLIPAGIEVVSVGIRKEVGHIPSATLNIIDGEVAKRTFSHSAGDWFVPGKEIEIKAAFTHNDLSETLFKGIVVKQNLRATKSGSTGLTVDCRHSAYRMTLGRKSRIFSQQSNEGIMAELLTENYNLSADIGPDGPQQERLVQFNATDWDFFMTRADASGKLCFVEDDQVQVITPNFALPASSELGFGTNLLEFEASLDSRTQPANVVTHRWSPSDQTQAEDAQNRILFEGPGNLTPDSLAQTTEYETETIHFGGSLYGYDNFKALSEARMMRFNLAKVCGKGKIYGTADLKPGDFVTLSGLGERMSGKVFVSGIRQEISRGTWYTHVQFGMSPKFHTECYDVHSPPAAGIMPAVTGLQIGIVESLKHTNNDEKQGLERIAVSLRVMDRNMEVWARPATLFAGDGRGVVFRPKKDDEVIVGFLDGDPAQAVILGSLYHNKGITPPLQNENDAHKDLNGIFTEQGMAITFHEADKTLILTTEKGPEITLNDGNTKSLSLTYKGSSITIKDEGIVIESAGTLELKAKKDIKISSDAASLDISVPAGTFGFTAREAELKGGTQMKLQAGKIDLN